MKPELGLVISNDKSIIVAKPKASTLPGAHKVVSHMTIAAYFHSVRDEDKMNVTKTRVDKKGNVLKRNGVDLKAAVYRNIVLAEYRKAMNADACMPIAHTSTAWGNDGFIAPNNKFRPPCNAWYAVADLKRVLRDLIVGKLDKDLG